MINTLLLNLGILSTAMTLCLANQCEVNPFEQGGPKRQRPAPIVRSAPPPPAPIPINPNVEFRGVFQYQGEWHFSLFNKGTNKGGWLKKGESFDGGKIEIEDFNPETEIIKLRGGMTLSLLKSKNQTLPVPSGQPVKKLPTISLPKITPRAPVAPGNRSPRTQIPSRVISPRK
jgi:hypothetical protein